MLELPFTPQNDKSYLTVSEKIALFGPGAVALPVPYGTKGGAASYMKYWQKRTFAETQTPEYQALLAQKEINVAIRYGKTDRVDFEEDSTLIGWDFDTDCPDIWEEFFAKNPQRLKHGLFSVGSTGFTMWARIKGPVPRSSRIVFTQTASGHPLPQRKALGRDGRPKGHCVEFFSESNHYTIIHGRHPEGMDYRIFVF